MLFACGQSDAETKTTPDTFVPYGKSDEIPEMGPLPVIPRDTIAGADIYNKYIPATLLNYINQSLPNMKLPNPSAWEKYWFDMYRKEKSLVNFVAGDFNCDGRSDYALLLADQKNRIVPWAFLAKDSGFEKTKLDEFDHMTTGPIDVGLDLLEKGDVHHLSEGGEPAKPVKLRCEGVTIIFFEKAARSYYWENGKMRSIQTGD